MTTVNGASGGKPLDVSKLENVDLLHTKAVGLIGVLFLTVTGAAPISAMLFNVPIAVGYGNGIGAPASFLVATIILLIFSVGYAAMASKVTAVGGFYSFISHGLGRELGMGFGFGSVVAYSVFEASLAGASPISPISTSSNGWASTSLAILSLTHIGVQPSSTSRSPRPSSAWRLSAKWRS